MNMINGNILTDSGAKNVLESFVCYHDIVLQFVLKVLSKMCSVLCNMALTASGSSLGLQGTSANGDTSTSASNISGKISEELLICKICFGKFSLKKLPKLLACSHTFCESCVKQYHSINTNGVVAMGANDEDNVFDHSSGSGSAGGNFPCPVCRKMTELPESGVEGLANNFTVLSLMEILVDRNASQVESGDNLDTCSIKSDLIGIARKDHRKRRRRERRGSCCSVFSVPTEVASSMTSLLGIPSVDAKCSICDQRFPESEFPCGHCVCTKCFVITTQRNRVKSGNEDEDVNNDQVDELPTCPACAQDLQADDQNSVNGDSVFYSHNGQAENYTNSSLNECQQQQNPFNMAESAQNYNIYPNLAVDALDTLDLNSKFQRISCTCNYNKRYNNGARGSPIPNERPPPYNPGLYFNANNNGSTAEEQHSCVSSNGCHSNSSRNGSPRRTPPSHRYSASVVADIQNVQHTPSSNTNGNGSQSSLAFSNPTYACGPGNSGSRPSQETNPPPLPHAPERPTQQQQQQQQQELYNVSQCSSAGHTYDCASNLSHHSYESPYTIRRTQSFRVRPPVPPRRHSSTPGSGLTLRRFHTATKKRSESAPCPSAPVPSGEGKDGSSLETYQSPSSLYGVSPPVPPPRRIYDSPHSSPVKCVKKFGKYSEVRMQTSTFRQPTKVAQSEKGDIVVVDEQQMTVQVFTYAGDYLSMFKVIGVQGASFFSSDKLAVATHRGISIFSMAGELIKELSTGLSVNTFPYKFGFVVCTPKSIQIYRQSLTLVKEISKRKTTKSHLFNKLSKKQPDPGLFENLKDITVLTNKHIAVLDSGKGTIHVLDEDGNGKMTINPELEACGKLKNAEALTADRSNNFYVADTGNQRVLRFTNHGTFSKTLLNCKTSSAADKKLSPYGVVITDIGNLVVSLAGENAAEVRIYSLQ